MFIFSFLFLNHFNSRETLDHFFLISIVSYKKSAAHNLPFLSGCFQNFFFFFRLLIFFMSRFFRFLPMCLGMDFFECTMFGICSTSWICRFMPFPKFERFSATIISLIIFSASHYFWDFNDISIMCFFFLFY